MKASFPSILLVAVALAFALATPGCGDSEEPRADSASAAVAGSLPASFGLLRSPEAKPPASVKASLERNVGRGKPPRLLSAYRLTTPLGRAWLVEAEAGHGPEICLVLKRTGLSSCSPPAVARRIGLAVGLSEAASQSNPGARRFTVMAVVPDKVESVVIRPVGGRPQKLQVTDNTFMERGPAPILIEKYCTHRGSCRPPR